MTAPTSASTLLDKLKGALERAATSAGEQFISVIILGGVVKVSGLPWAAALSTAGGAALISLLLSVTQFAYVLPFWADVLERGVKTFAASLLATLGGGLVDLLSVPWHDALDVAALAALLAIIKGYLSPNGHMSASLLPAPVAARLAGAELTGPPTFHKPE